MQKHKENFKAEIILISIITGYLVHGVILIGRFNREIYNIAVTGKIGAVHWIILAAVIITVTGINIMSPYSRTYKLMLFVSALAYGITLGITAGANLYLNLTICVIIYYICHYCWRESDGINVTAAEDKISGRAALAGIILLTVIHAAGLSWLTIMRHRIFETAAFDFGIFAQLF